MHLYIKSIPTNIDKLNNYLLSLDIMFSMIGLTKTWLKEEMLEIYELSEYKSIHLTRPPEKEEEYLYTFIIIRLRRKTKNYYYD